MTANTITHKEFNIRLAQSTGQMRQKRLTLDAQATELEDLIGLCSSMTAPVRCLEGRKPCPPERKLSSSA